VRRVFPRDDGPGSSDSAKQECRRLSRFWLSLPTFGADQVEKDIPDTPVTGPVSEDGVTAEPDPEAEFEDTSGEADDEEGVAI